jgi:hypothetical protein
MSEAGWSATCAKYHKQTGDESRHVSAVAWTSLDTHRQHAAMSLPSLKAVTRKASTHQKDNTGQAEGRSKMKELRPAQDHMSIAWA